MSGGNKREGRQTRSTRNKQQEGDMEENVASTEENGANMLVASIPSSATRHDKANGSSKSRNQTRISVF
ncbi:unnamed protein product [Knipowitschia caucasica]